jgi:C_GCAxxG_C_C family probable redox protein
MTHVDLRDEAIAKAVSLFDQGYACSQSVLLAFSGQFGLDDQIAKRIASTFGGGMGRLRKTCGAVTGGFMVLGLAYGNELSNDMETKLNAYRKVRELNQSVESIHGTTNCADLLKKHATTADVEARKHHKIICRRIVGEVAGLVFDMVQERFLLERTI